MAISSSSAAAASRDGAAEVSPLARSEVADFISGLQPGDRISVRWRTAESLHTEASHQVVWCGTVKALDSLDGSHRAIVNYDAGQEALDQGGENYLPIPECDGVSFELLHLEKLQRAPPARRPANLGDFSTSFARSKRPRNDFPVEQADSRQAQAAASVQPRTDLFHPDSALLLAKVMERTVDLAADLASGQAVSNKRQITGEGLKVPMTILGTKVPFYPYLYIATDLYPEPIIKSNWKQDMEAWVARNRPHLQEAKRFEFYAELDACWAWVQREQVTARVFPLAKREDILPGLHHAARMAQIAFGNNFLAQEQRIYASTVAALTKGFVDMDAIIAAHDKGEKK